MLDRTNQVIARLSGIVLLVAGLGLGTLVTWIVTRQLMTGAKIELAALVFSAVCASVAVVCGTIGLRLTFNRPNRYRSVLPPSGWYALALVFVLLAPWLGFVAIQGGDYQQLVGAACTMLLAFWCWKAARTAAARGRSDRAGR